ncbi:MAG: hypothetical protein ACJATI_002115 [Halioglobus sp.]|jgi:hypothetical protein
MSFDVISQNTACIVKGIPDAQYFDINQSHPNDYKVRLYFNIVRRTDKTGGYPQSRIKDFLIPAIESGFNNTGINFEYICEVTYVNSTPFITVGTGNQTGPFSFCAWADPDPNVLQHHNDGIDIYIVDGGAADAAGRVNSIPGDYIVLANAGGTFADFEGTTIVHELGHIFGLVHMHTGSMQNGNYYPFNTCSNWPAGAGDCNFGCPPVNNIDCTTMSYVASDACAEHAGNGSTAGDLIPDTPPSDDRAEKLHYQQGQPGTGIPACSADLTYIPEGQYETENGIFYYEVLDPQGQIYNPDVTNYMSTINQKSCRDTFTPNQITVMKNHIADHPILQPFHSDPNDLICDCDYDKIIYLRDDADWSDVILDYDIDNTQLTDWEIVVQKDLTFDTDYTFNNATFTMGDGANIIVEAGNTLEVNTGTISTCGTRWGEIYLESSASLDFLNVDMSTGTNAIRTENNPNNSIGKSDIIVHSCTIDDFTESGITIFTSSTASLQTITINNVVDYGINLAEDVDTDVLIGIDIDGADRGIRIINSSFWHQINDCTFTNCHIGVRYNGTSGSIHDSDFGKTTFAVTIHNSAHSFIYRNNIGYSQNGVTVSNSFNTNINRNNIGLPQDYGNYGIRLSNVSQSLIEGNPSIYASKFGIRGDLLTDVDVYAWRDQLDPNIPVLSSNNIYMQGTQNTNSGGILFTASSSCDIEDNFIHGANVAVGIEMNNSPSNTISNNYVSISSIPNLFRSAAIRNVGSMSIEVLENETYSSNNANGILAQNSADGTYRCNFIYDTHDALCIEHHSAAQELETNHKINSHNFDFVTRSRLGLQRNLGNEYWEGSARAFFDPLTEDANIAASQFLVDAGDPFHMPSDPVPVSGWFVPNFTSDEQCSGALAGPGGTGTFFSNPVKLCDYWDDIKPLKISDPQLFLIKVSHIINYFNANPLMAIPDCIELDPIFINLCGIHELMDVVDRITKVGQIDPSRSALVTAINNMRQLQVEYDVLTNPVSKENKYAEIENLNTRSKPAFDQEAAADYLEIQNIKTALGNINCSQYMIQVIKDAWTIYLNELEEDLLDTNPRLTTTVNTISSLCSDEYGDAVHLARSIALNQGSTTYYDTYDGCEDITQMTKRSSKEKLDNLSFDAFPNPSTGNLHIEFNEPVSGLLQIFNSQGEQVYRVEMLVADLQGLQLHNSGVYIAKFTPHSGRVITQKIIIVD